MSRHHAVSDSILVITYKKGIRVCSNEALNSTRLPWAHSCIVSSCHRFIFIPFSSSLRRDCLYVAMAANSAVGAEAVSDHMLQTMWQMPLWGKRQHSNSLLSTNTPPNKVCVDREWSSFVGSFWFLDCQTTLGTVYCRKQIHQNKPDQNKTKRNRTEQNEMKRNDFPVGLTRQPPSCVSVK